MNYELNIAERYLLLQALPKEGNFATMSTIDDLHEKLYPTTKEIEKYKIESDGASIHWNLEGNNPIQIQLSDAQIKMIQNGFKSFSDNEKLNIDLYRLYKKFKSE